MTGKLELLDVLAKLKDAVLAGELDAQIEAASGALKAGFGKWVASGYGIYQPDWLKRDRAGTFTIILPFCKCTLILIFHLSEFPKACVRISKADNFLELPTANWRYQPHLEIPSS